MKPQAFSPLIEVPIHEISLDRLLNEMSDCSNRVATRAYEFFATSGFAHGHDLEDWFTAEKELLKPVAIDIKDGNTEFVVTAEVPGFDARDLDLHMNGCRLIIAARKDAADEKRTKGNTIYSERKSQQVYRSIELPAAVAVDNAHAELKNGILELRLPKAAQSKQIAVAAA